MKRLLVLGAIVVAVALLLPAGALAKQPTFGQAVDALFARGYPQSIDHHLYRMPGTNPKLGFSWAGTGADNARARYLARQMRAIGLKDVHLERVPVDVFDFKSATVGVHGRTMTASTFAGIRPTGVPGLTARVVYAHDGTAQDFDALAEAGVSVKGKLVLVDSDFQDWWLNYPAAEATYRGAIGVIMTSGPHSAPWYEVSPTALGSNDAEYTYSSVPMVYICKRDGDWLKQRLAARHVTATMRLREKVRLAADGGHGYNVFGDLPGTTGDDSFVLFGAHHDVHFRAATDDAACVSTNLAIAKAMVLSGYKPRHTVRFMITTGEEFGYTDAWWDWSIGAWYAITHTHPDWAGECRGFLNSDYFSGRGSKLKIGTEAELTPVVKQVTKASRALLPYGSAIEYPITTWQDGWTFTAAGVPSVLFAATKGSVGYTDPIYHTNYMKPNLIEWPYLAKICKVIQRLQLRFNNGLAPYDFATRADDLAGAVQPADLKAAGCDAGTVDALQTAIGEFQTAAAAFEARRASIPTGNAAADNESMRPIEKSIGTGFTALDAWDSQVYPHEQVLADVQNLQAAVADLQQTTPDTDDALTSLSNVALTGYGLVLSHAVYAADLQRRAPDYFRADWGSQGHLIDYLDVMPEYNDIAAGTWGPGTITSLQAMAASDVTDLNARLSAMTTVLQTITPQIAALD